MATPTSAPEQPKKKTSTLDSSHPVLVPHRPELFYPTEKFWEAVLTQLREDNAGQTKDVEMKDSDAPEIKKTPEPEKADPKKASPYVSALLGTVHPSEGGIAPENLTRTTNDMPAYESTLVPTLDLFNDLQESISNEKLDELLTKSWQFDPLETLKIIFQCRSIHLGKGEKENFYKCVAWLVNSAGLKGKATVLANLEWVVQRTIVRKKQEKKEKKEPKELDLLGTGEAEEKKKKEEEEAKKKESGEDEEIEQDENDPVFSHGYWKDLPNILVLEVQNSLSIDANIHDILNPPPKPGSKKKTKGGRHRIPPGTTLTAEGKKKLEEEKAARPPPLTAEEKLQSAKATRHAKEKERHEKFLKKFDETFYRLLHLCTARAFAAQLHQDLDALKSGDKKRMRNITFAAKWAPSLEAQHDKHTFLASSIAEILFPPEHPLCADNFTDREGYLKLAREHYRRVYLSPLRAHLRIVERDISANTYDKINYQRVPSLAMTRYKKLFYKKDETRFSSYLQKVALGKAKISGAVLTPSTLVHRADSISYNSSDPEQKIERQIVDGQWNSLVNSIKERGTLASALAVVDVSGSMSYPSLNDGTTPMDSSIGLGMLLAEIAEEPFKNIIITFSETPEIFRIDGAITDNDEPWGFTRRVSHIKGAPWGMNTNFLAVFEDLLLPVAVQNKVKPEDMVKKIFVFSDMQFDDAETSNNLWETGYERIKRKYTEAGYEVPTLVYWNLASSGAVGKPVTGETEGVVMMAGGGAGTLKAFLADLSGELEEEVEEEEAQEEAEEEDWDMVDDETAGEKRKTEEEEGGKKKKKKIDPVTAMKRLLANEAYAGLKIME